MVQDDRLANAENADATLIDDAFMHMPAVQRWPAVMLPDDFHCARGR